MARSDKRDAERFQWLADGPQWAFETNKGVVRAILIKCDPGETVRQVVDKEMRAAQKGKL